MRAAVCRTMVMVQVQCVNVNYTEQLGYALAPNASILSKTQIPNQKEKKENNRIESEHGVGARWCVLIAK